MILGLSPLALGYTLAAVFLASLVRGYSGFGLSALIVTSLALVIPPREVVPIAMLLEIIASIGLLRQIWPQVAWRPMGRILLGAVFGLPLGLLLLVALPADTMRIVISLAVLSASIALWFGLRMRGLERRGGQFGTGLVSGLFNGAAAVGGLPVVLYFLSTATRAAAMRATLMVYLVILGLYGLAASVWHDLVDRQMLLRSLLFCLPLVIGVALGNHRFVKTTPESFRRFALILLMVLASLGLLRAVFA